MTTTPTDLTAFELPTRELTAWMDDRALGTGPISDVVPLVGGTQNILVRFRRGSDGFVLRRPPLAKRADSDETMRREVTVLEALRGSAVPHPDLIAHEPDPSLIGAAFYLMEPVDGITAGAGLRALEAQPGAKARLGLAMADGLAALATVDHLAVGLDGFGRAGSFLARQVARWRSQLDGYRRVPGYADPGVEVDRIADWLDAHRPHDGPVGILHGDYHLGNVIVTTTGELSAIVDWELATIGEPILDLAHLLVTWPGSGRSHNFAGLVPDDLVDGFTEPDEIVERFRAATGWDLATLPWYRVLAAYRLGIILEGTHVRALVGEAPRDVGDRLHDTAVALLEDAAEATR